MAKYSSNLTPRIINTFFLRALQMYFISHIEYSWSPNDAKTEIDIHPDYEEDDNMEKSVPVLTVQNGPVTIESAGIGTGIYTANPRIINYNSKKTKLNGIWDSTLQFNVSSQVVVDIQGISTDDVSELAFEIGMFMQMIRYDAGKTLQIQNLGAVSISSVQATGKIGDRNRYTAQVILPYIFTVQRVWQPINSGVLLRTIETDLIPVRESVPLPGDLDDHGNPINIGEKGATNTGGQNGNWGGKGGIEPDNPTGDGIDDNSVTLRIKTTKSFDDNVANDEDNLVGIRF